MTDRRKSKFEQHIQEGDEIIYNDSLECRVNISQLKRVAIHEDLEEAANEYAHNQGLKQISGDWQSKEAVDFQADHGLFLNIDIINAFKAGSQWQNEQMMKSAIIGTALNSTYPTRLELNTKLTDVYAFDKVKVIIVKEK